MAHTDRVRHTSDKLAPTVLMRAVLALLLMIVTLVAYARLTDRPLEAQPPQGAILAERVIEIDSTISGYARITDGAETVIAQYGAGEAVFISTIDRVLRRERLSHGVAQTGPVHLRLREGNRLAVFDPNTGEETELVSFGADNVAAFRALLQEN